jgi:hypothetical protein
MDAAELFGRAREKLRRKTERFAVPEARAISLAATPANVPELPPRADAPALLKQTLAGDAAKLLAGKWALFGWNEVEVSSPPDWHRDWIRRTSVPGDERELNHRALPGGADARNIWEINRWAEPVRLAMHGWLGDDVTAIRRAQEWLEDWVRKNPLGRGINWSSALEGGLRLVNFCWFDALARKHGAWSAEPGDAAFQRRQRELVEAIVPAHVWWVKRYPSFGSSANNHRLGELTGLLLAVKRWPELEETAGPAEELWRQIAGCVLAQFAEDGGNREQALHYHLFAFEMALHACRAMGVTDGPVIERLRRAAEFFVRMSHPQEPWDYGDSDDAQIVPLTMDRRHTVAEWSAWMRGSGTGLQPVCRTGILPVQEDYNAAGSLRYWLGDFATQVNADERGQDAHATHRSQTCATDWWIAPDSGMAVIERDGWKVRLDASPLGFGKLAAHGHCDALHVSIWDGEHALVIDPGTGGYFGSKELRAELASWNAHNGPQPVGGFKTPGRMGTFLWTEHHARPELRCEGDSARASLNHEGLRVSRSVQVADDAVTVEDSEEGGQPFSVRWLFAPRYEVSELPGGQNAFVVRRRGGAACWLLQMDKRHAASLSSGAASSAFNAKERCVAVECFGSAKSISRIRRFAGS